MTFKVYNDKLFLDLQNQRETVGSQGKYFVQCWVLFLCEILEVVSKDKEMKPPHCGDEFLSCLIGHKYLLSKCITIERDILKNGWFQGKYMTLMLSTLDNYRLRLVLLLIATQHIMKGRHLCHLDLTLAEVIQG